MKANSVRISGLRIELRCESAVVRGSVLAAERDMLGGAASTPLVPLIDKLLTSS